LILLKIKTKTFFRIDQSNILEIFNQSSFDLVPPCFFGSSSFHPNNRNINLTIICYQNSENHFDFFVEEISPQVPSRVISSGGKYWANPIWIMFRFSLHYINFNQTIFNQTFMENETFIAEVGMNLNSRPQKANDGKYIYDRNLDDWASFRVDAYEDGSEYLFFNGYRLETLHPTILVLSISFHLMVLIFAFVFSRFQPLKAHGGTPILYITFSTIQLLICSIYFTSLETFNKFRCFLPILNQPINSSLILLFPLHLSRFILIILMSQSQSLFREAPTILQKNLIKFFLFVMKVFSYRLTHIMIVAFNFLICCMIELDFVSRYNFDICVYGFEKELVHLFRTLQLLITFSLIPLTLIDLFLICWGAIAELKKLKKCNCLMVIFFPFYAIKFAWKIDIFYFRIQYYCIGLFIILPLNISLYMLREGYFGFNLVDKNVRLILFPFFDTTIDFSVLFMQTGLPLIFSLMTAFKWIWAKKIKNQKINTSEFIEFFREEKKYKLLRAFSKKEMSVENVECFQDILKYQKLTSKNKRIETAKLMNEMYFNGISSPLEVNLPGSTIRKFRSDYAAETFEQGNLFDELSEKVAENIGDTYSRFIISPEFTNYLKKQQYMSEIIGEETEFLLK
jgi:hypothetical protein